MKLGFIGTGSMGSLLIESFIQSGAVSAREIIASNRTRSKTERLALQFPGLRVAESNREAAAGTEILLLCVKPLEYKQVIDDIRDVVQPEQILVSITSPVMIRHLEELLPCKIAKVIPSITNAALKGASLCVFSKRMNSTDREKLESLLRHISIPLEICEEHTRVASDISSCGPAFLAFFIQSLIDAAIKKTGIDREQAMKLSGEMMLGTGQLLVSGTFTPELLQQRVSVPGGITAEGLRLLKIELDGVFDQLLNLTHMKFEDDVQKVEAALFGTKVE